MHVNMNGPAFKPTMQSTDNRERDLRDEVAKIVFSNMASDEAIGTAIAHDLDMKALAEQISRVSFNFADAFMRERYERDSIARSEMKANIPNNFDGWKTTS